MNTYFSLDVLVVLFFKYLKFLFKVLILVLLSYSPDNQNTNIVFTK